MITVSELKAAIFHRCEIYNQNFPIAKREWIKLPTLQAVNHIVANDVASSLDLPRQNLSAMDGFALCKGADLAENSVFDVIGESCAGSPFLGECVANQAVRIFTGAVVPTDCDTVVMQEDTDFAPMNHKIDKTKPYTITLTKPANLGANIRKQGEEIVQNETVLEAGKRLNPSDISLLANLGISSVTVVKPLTVGILATGDELVNIGEPLKHLAQIYNSNTPTLKTLLSYLPIKIHDYDIIPDDLEKTTQAVKLAIHECDVIISSAGVSVGDYDFLTTVVDNLGKINHYKVLMKPGKPFVFGEFNTDSKQVLYFGLPGNPLSTVVGCLQFVRPALWQLTGCKDDDLPKTLQLSAVCQKQIIKKGRRQEFQRAYFSQNAHAEFVVTPFDPQDSHRVKQLTKANCLLILPAECTGVNVGDKVMIEVFDWNFG
ncbi:molybdopterin molybdotransferase MoeA [Moraxella macacae]|nr:molybdopterin molybdotransferase MoeA [Moraxella macacae]